jgi:hypothetical protein
VKRTVIPQVLWRCPKCRQLMAQDGPHAPHWVVRGDGRSVLVDCVGRPLAVAS